MIIVPPEKIKKIVDVTAQYVRENGREVENLLREKYAEDRRYDFLNITNPYYGYYEELLGK